MTPRCPWLGLLPAMLAALDVTLTLVGQGPAYWSGDFACVQEWNPVGSALLQLHPLAFGTAGLAWTATLALTIGRLPGSLAVTAASLATIGHAVGGASWLWQFEPLGATLGIAYLLAAERLLGWLWRRAGYGI